MHSDAQTRKAGGRLSREDQRRLGDILQRVYDDVVRQGVPDRFKELLGELDGPQQPGFGGAGAARSAGGPDVEQSREPDRLVGRGSQHPYHKGSSS
jgi:Anti-sigma factor NepR